MELVDFLRARLDEDEEIAKEAGERSMEWRLVTPLDDAELGDAWWLNPPEKYHAERHDPARVLAEVEAKRAVVDAYRPPGADPHPGQPCINYDGQDPADYDASDACARHVEASKTHLHHDYVLRLLARPFRAHPDFDPAWLEG